MNNDKNQTNNSTNEKVTRVSSMEEMIAILDGIPAPFPIFTTLNNDYYEKE